MLEISLMREKVKSKNRFKKIIRYSFHQRRSARPLKDRVPWNSAETGVCFVRCHVSLWGEMSAMTSAQRAAKARERESAGAALVNAVSQRTSEAERPLRVSRSSCFRSGSRSSYNKCFMTNANKSQLWNSSHAMSEPVQNRITTPVEFFPLSKCIPYELWCGTAGSACIPSESCFWSPDWKESQSVGKQTRRKHWDSGVGGVCVFPSQACPRKGAGGWESANPPPLLRGLGAGRAPAGPQALQGPWPGPNTVSQSVVRGPVPVLKLLAPSSWGEKGRNWE